MTVRRFPPPSTFEEANNACFIVKDANGFAVSYVSFEGEPGRRAAANLMTKDEAPEGKVRRPHRLDIRYLRDNGLLRTDDEEQFAARRGVMHKPRLKPLYPC
jgi:hypothetical protein